MAVIPTDEEEAVRARFWHPRPDDVVVDVGSFEGTYTLPALEAGAYVHAVDARAHTLRTLDALAEANGLAWRLSCSHAVIYDGSAYPEQLTSAIVSGPYASARDMFPDADATPLTLDALVAQCEMTRLDWLKVDVEGGELGVVRGGLETLKRLRPRVLIEDHSRCYPWVREQHTTANITGLLQSLDYEVEFVPETYVDYLVGTP